MTLSHLNIFFIIVVISYLSIFLVSPIITPNVPFVKLYPFCGKKTFEITPSKYKEYVGEITNLQDSASGALSTVIQADLSVPLSKIQEQTTPEELAKWLKNKRLFTANSVDAAYLLGVFNVSGIDGLYKEIQRLKQLNIKPHEIISKI